MACGFAEGSDSFDALDNREFERGRALEETGRLPPHEKLYPPIDPFLIPGDFPPEE